MAKILILGESGSGKSTSLGENKTLGIQGLNPKETFLIMCTNKGLPFPGWKKSYQVVQPDPANPTTYIGNLFVSNSGEAILKMISFILRTRPEIKNYVIDDTNYVMQDHYMLKGKTSVGYNIFKDIGYEMALIFQAADLIDNVDKNFIMMAHYESYIENDETKYRFKTVGKMVQDYITPEGKFEIVLVTHNSYDDKTGSSNKEFVTNYDGVYKIAKSPIGMFSDKRIKNDLGLVVKSVFDYENI